MAMFGEYSDRKGPYIYTASGKLFWPMDPRVEDVDIESIAQHLSAQCRFLGAVSGPLGENFYSVAEHSVQCSFKANGKFSREALLHDAAEAYCGDMVRPLKYSAEFEIPYKEMETRIEQVIAEKFGLKYPWPDDVKEVDDRMCASEISYMIKRPPNQVKRDFDPKVEGYIMKFQMLNPLPARLAFMRSAMSPRPTLEPSVVPVAASVGAAGVPKK